MQPKYWKARAKTTILDRHFLEKYENCCILAGAEWKFCPRVPSDFKHEIDLAQNTFKHNFLKKEQT